MTFDRTKHLSKKQMVELFHEKPGPTDALVCKCGWERPYTNWMVMGFEIEFDALRDDCTDHAAEHGIYPEGQLVNAT